MKMLASAIEDRVQVTMICRTMLSVHTTYPLCGWVQSGTSKCGTKPVGGLSISAGGGGCHTRFIKNINRAIIYAPGSSHAYIQQNHQDITTHITNSININRK
jgi:hypothetical protein